MVYILTINLGEGSLKTGFKNVRVQIWDKDQSSRNQFDYTLEASQDLSGLIEKWDLFYEHLYNSDNRSSIDFIDEDEITNFSNFNEKAIREDLYNALNNWLNNRLWLKLEKEKLGHVDSSSEIIVIIESQDLKIQKLPWHLWDFFHRYPSAEVGLSGSTYEGIDYSIKIPRGRVRILLIIGETNILNQNGEKIEGENNKLDVEKDIELISKIPNKEVVIKKEPQRDELVELLSDETGWDILFFAGHSSTEENCGQLQINPNDNLRILELETSFKVAIKNGLRLAIFNSCDGLGIAQDLRQLNIPQTIVMKSPIPDEIAHLFLKYFLDSFANGKSLYLSLREAREKLKAHKDEYFCPSWLPVISQNPATFVPYWSDLGRPLPSDFSPYKGLFSFTKDDNDYFFGRETFVNKLVQKVIENPIVALTGNSGSGKSSVIFAGLIPCLCPQNSAQISSEISSEISYQNQWEYLSIHLGDNPISSLNNALDEFNNFPNSQKKLLVIDRFEEIFTLKENQLQENIEGKNIPEINNFLEQLLQAKQNQNNLHICIVLRADFRHYLLNYPSFARELESNYIELSSMNDQELLDVIIKPAEKVKTTFEKGLAERILKEIKDEPGNLPLLQFALTELWKKQENASLTNSAYQEIEGVEGALIRYADEVYNEFNSGEKLIAKRIFLALISIGKNRKDTRKQILKETLINDENPQLMNKVINDLATAKLIVINQENQIDLIHESLIYYWDKLEELVNENRKRIQLKDNLEEAAEEWENNKKPKWNSTYLLQGEKLSEAQKFLQQNTSIIILKLEKEFVNQSQLYQWVKYTGLGGLIVFLLISIPWVYLTLDRQYKIGNLNKKIAEVKTLLPLEPVEALVSAINITGKNLSDDSSEEIIEAIKEILKQAIEVSKEKNILKYQRYPRSIAIASNNQYIVSGIDDGSVRILDQNGEQIEVLIGHKDGIKSVAISPNNQYIASAGSDKNIILWNFQGEKIRTFSGHEKVVMSVDFDPKSQKLVSSSLDKTIRLWDLQGNQIDIFLGHEELIYSVKFSPDGKYIISGSLDKTIRLWDLQGNQIDKFQGHKGRIYRAEFSPDGKLIVSGSTDETIQIRNQDGEIKKIIPAKQGLVYAVTFTPDGKQIISGGADGTIKIWDLEGNLIETLIGHKEGVNSVFVSKNGKYLVSSSYDDTVRFWELGNPQNLEDTNVKPLLKIACNRLENHPLLKYPQEEVAENAKKTCQEFS